VWICIVNNDIVLTISPSHQNFLTSAHPHTFSSQLIPTCCWYRPIEPKKILQHSNITAKCSNVVYILLWCNCCLPVINKQICCVVQQNVIVNGTFKKQSCSLVLSDAGQKLYYKLASFNKHSRLWNDKFTPQFTLLIFTFWKVERLKCCLCCARGYSNK